MECVCVYLHHIYTRIYSTYIEIFVYMIQFKHTHTYTHLGARSFRDQHEESLPAPSKIRPAEVHDLNGAGRELEARGTVGSTSLLQFPIIHFTVSRAYPSQTPGLFLFNLPLSGWL